MSIEALASGSGPPGAARCWYSALALIVSLWIMPLPGLAQTAAPWLDTFASRLEILALMQLLNAEILSGSSATVVLQKWCRDHQMAADPSITARVISGINKIPSPEQLQRLQVAKVSDIAYRRVELRCGSHVLSEADNWYVPSRLTAAINNQLQTSTTPFGTAVQSLKPYRRTFAVRILWSPLPAGWEQQPRPAEHEGSGRALRLPKELFEHRAILYTGQG